MLFGCALMFLSGSLMSSSGEREGVLWIVNGFVGFAMAILLGATLVAPAKKIVWDEVRLSVTRRGKTILLGDWRALEIERIGRRKYRIEDPVGREVRLFANRLPEALVSRMEKGCVPQINEG